MFKLSLVDYKPIGLLIMLLATVALSSGCSSLYDKTEMLPATTNVDADYTYLIGPGDGLSIFVWRNPDVSSSVPVRPDGKISTPLVDDLQASGKTTTQLARELETILGEYIRDPLVTVTVTGFQGEYSETIRVVGEAAEPQAIPYRKDMTALDVMIQVGGLTEFADGNKASIVRNLDGKQTQSRVHLDDLIRDGDISANVQMSPGDILIIPEAWF